MIAGHNDFQSTPSCRAKPWTVVCSRRSCHGGPHEHVGALDRLHMRFGNAQECVAADAGIVVGASLNPVALVSVEVLGDDPLLVRY